MLTLSISKLIQINSTMLHSLQLSLADEFAIPQDQIRLVLSTLLFVLPGSFLLQLVKGRFAKSLLSNSISLALLLYIFKERLIYPLGYSIFVYALMLMFKDKSHKPILLFSVIAMSYTHIQRMIRNYGGYDIDQSVLVMIYVCKFTYLGFSLKDGKSDKTIITQEQFQNRLVQVPSLYSYFTYILFLPCGILGPVFQIRQLDNYLQGKNQYSNIPKVPCLVQGLKKLFMWIVLTGAYVFLFINQLNLSYYSSQEMDQDSLLVFFVKTLVIITLLRLKYHSIWKLSEACVSFSGFNYKPIQSGHSFQGVHCDTWKSQTAISVKQCIDNWNMGCQKWLKNVIYFRIYPISQLKQSKGKQQKAGLIVLMFSALWHGFYFGYFLSFFFWALLVFISKYLFKFKETHPKLFGMYNGTSILGKAILFFLSKFFFSYVGVYFQLLSTQMALKVVRKSFLIPQILIIMGYFYLSASSKPKTKIKKGE